MQYHPVSSALNHTSGDGRVRLFVDQDQRAGRAVGAIGVKGNRRRCNNADAGDIVADETSRRYRREGRHVEPMHYFTDMGNSAPCADFDQVAAAGGEWFVVEPADGGIEAARYLGLGRGVDEDVAARDVDGVIDLDTDRLRRSGVFERPVISRDCPHPGGAARGQGKDRITDSDPPGFDATEIATILAGL